MSTHYGPPRPTPPRQIVWPPSFPDAFEKAQRYFSAHWYHDAEIEYLAAARVAPSKALEQTMLECAWIASQRHDGIFQTELDPR